MQSKFWQYINGIGNVQTEAFWNLFGSDKRMRGVATELLLSELPEAKQWVGWGDMDGKYPLVDALLALAAYTHDNASPKAMQYSPGDVTLHCGGEEFKNVLFQKPRRGWITFSYDICCGDGFGQPSYGERLVSFIRGRDIYYSQDESSKGYNARIDAAAIGFIRGTKVELYPFPKNWTEIVEYVRGELDKMTATEKAAVELPHELRAFVELLGYDAVYNELQKLHA